MASSRRQSATHEDFTRPHSAEGPSNRSFGLTLGVFFLLVWLLPLLRHRPPRWWALLTGALFLIAAAAVPHLLQPLNRLWMRGGLLLGRITNPIITGLMFFVVITPAAFVARLMGKDSLRLRLDESAESYWIPREPSGTAQGTMRNQF
jgi:hypothetical protein